LLQRPDAAWSKLRSRQPGRSPALENCCVIPLQEVRGGCSAAPRDRSSALLVYVQLGVLVCPFELGEGEKLPLQVNSVTPPWLIVRV